MKKEEILVKMVLDRWLALLDNVNGILDSLTDEQLQQEIAPGRNRGIYVLGHLTAVHDDLFRLLDMGGHQFTELHEPFLKQPDKAVTEIPSAKQLRETWNSVNQLLNKKMEQLTTEEWFQKHTAVSAEEFVNEPHRNKLNIVLTRSSHLSYHYGQLALLKPKKQA